MEKKGTINKEDIKKKRKNKEYGEGIDLMTICQLSG